MRQLVQFPLTEEQQRAYGAWVSSILYYNSDMSEQGAETFASQSIFNEYEGYKYWATRLRHHFCRFPTVNAGWYDCMGCWVD